MSTILFWDKIRFKDFVDITELCENIYHFPCCVVVIQQTGNRWEMKNTLDIYINFHFQKISQIFGAHFSKKKKKGYLMKKKGIKKTKKI